MLRAWWRRKPATVPTIPPDHRVYALGDIHGRADLLDTVLASIARDIAARPVAIPLVVLLGDYVDRGPQSRAVIERLVALSERPGFRCLRGNHEEVLLAVLADPSAAEDWLVFGGLETMASYGFVPDGRPALDLVAAFAEGLPASHRAFLAGLPLTFACGDYLFVHAGLRPGRPLAEQSPEDLLWIRDEFLRSRAWHGHRVVHGHTPVREAEILPNRINLDTGAYATGRLTCLVLEGREAAILEDAPRPSFDGAARSA